MHACLTHTPMPLHGPARPQGALETRERALLTSATLDRDLGHARAALDVAKAQVAVMSCVCVSFCGVGKRGRQPLLQPSCIKSMSVAALCSLESTAVSMHGVGGMVVWA